MCHYKSDRSVHLNLACLCGSLPSCSWALKQAKSLHDTGSMQHLACLKKRGIMLDSLEVVSWPLNWEVQIRASAIARGKKPGRSWFFPDSSFKPSPWPQLAPLSFRIITQSAVTKPLSADLPLPAEWGEWGLILGPSSNTCWLFDFTQITKLEIIPILQLRLSRKLIHFNYINTKCIFIRHVHEGCHEKKF